MASMTNVNSCIGTRCILQTVVNGAVGRFALGSRDRDAQLPRLRVASCELRVDAMALSVCRDDQVRDGHARLPPRLTPTSFLRHSLAPEHSAVRVPFGSVYLVTFLSLGRIVTRAPASFHLCVLRSIRLFIYLSLLFSSFFFFEPVAVGAALRDVR